MSKPIISSAQQQTVRDAVSAVEQRTDAEIVVVLARQSDHYLYIATLWAAVIALIVPVPLLMLPTALEPATVSLIQLLVFIVLALVFRFEAALARLTPRRVRQWRATQMARYQFLENNLHCTAGQTGVLVFVSLLEHHAEILADQGIHRHVEQSQWQSIIDTLIGNIRAGELAAGLTQTVHSCGELLIAHVPATSEKNELPNHLVILD